MSATEELMRLDPCKSIVPFGDGTETQFNHSDMHFKEQPGGISNQEGEFLYGLIRILRPMMVLETGTNYGCSASYICLGLRDNKRGHLTTIEHDGTMYDIAERKLAAMGFTNFCIFKGKVEQHQKLLDDYGDTENKLPSLDFLWLDTELNQRYNELLRYFPHMKHGAVVCIHDLWGLDFDQFGGMPDELVELLKSGKLRAVTFQTQHGLTVLQKRRDHDALADISKHQYDKSNE